MASRRTRRYKPLVIMQAFTALTRREVDRLTTNRLTTNNESDKAYL